MHGGHADEAPRTVKLYVNRDVEFDCVEAAVATHTLHMPSAMSDEAEFPLSLAKFNNVSSVSLFVCDNYGGSVCRLQYVGLKGTFLAPKVTPPCSCVQPQLQLPLHTLPYTLSLTHSPSHTLPHSHSLTRTPSLARAQVRVGAIKNAVYEAKPQLHGALRRPAAWRCAA